MPLRIRHLSVPEILRRARQDPRTLSYNLLPLTGGPARRSWLAQLARSGRPQTPGLVLGPRAAALRADLEGRGYTETIPLLSPAAARHLRDWFSCQPCHDPYRPHLGDFLPAAPPSPDSNMGYYRVEQILAAPGVLALFNSPLVLAVAEAFLGCIPTLDNIGCWWSFAGRPAIKGTQWFHRDWDNIRAVKLFFYLTDVEPGDGAFEFIPFSNQDVRLVTINRIADAEVAQIYGAGAGVRMTGLAGTAFMADTFGIHRGRLPADRPRLLLTAQYGIWRTPHSPAEPFLPKRHHVDPYVNRVYMCRS